MTRSFFSRILRQPVPKKQRRAERRRTTNRALGVAGLGLERLEDRRVLAAGMLDPTFGVGGVVLDDLNTIKNDQVFATAIQTVMGDDKIVVAGLQNNVSGSQVRDVLVARYNSDGTRDLSFATSGVLVVNASDVALGEDGINSIIVDDQNRILLFGTAMTTIGPSNFNGVLTMRLTESGQIDTTFDGDGKVITVLQNALSQPISVSDASIGPNNLSTAAQADGKIVVGISTNVTGGTGRDFALLRYNDDGSLDTTFDSDGYVITDLLAGGTDTLQDMAIQSDGKIVAVGSRSIGTSTDDFAVVRYNSDGSLDTSFGTGGVVLTNLVPSVAVSQDIATSVFIEPNGQIVVGGHTTVRVTLIAPNQRDFVVARYNSDGSLDDAADDSPSVSFGTGASSVAGTLRVSMNGAVSNDFETSFSMIRQPDGKYVIGGTFGTTNNTRRFGLARLLPTDGSFDTTFNGTGIATAVIDTLSFVVMSEVLVQPDGLFLAAGYRFNTSTGGIDVAMARWESGLLAAFAGGPYSLAEPGGSVVLDGSSNGTGTVTYEWDLDGDGIFGETGVDALFGDEVGENATFTVSGIDGPTTFNIVLRASTIDEVAHAATTVTITNVAPSITADNAVVTVNEGDTATNTGTFGDVGPDLVTLSASVGMVMDNGDGTWSWSYATTDGPDDNVLVTITATDDEGDSTEVSFQLNVDNVAPSVVADNAVVTVSEGDTATNSGTYADPGDDTVTLIASAGILIDNGDGTWSWSYGTADGPDDSVLVTITATDSDGDSSDSSFQVNVNNVAPSVAADDAVVTVNEGDTAANSGTYSDPGVDGIALMASVGVVLDNGDGTWSWTYGTSDGPDDSVLVTITATDSDGDSSSTSFQLNVDNVAPNVAADNAVVTVNEGDTATNSGTHGDPGVDGITLLASVGIVLDNGDGTWSWSYGTMDGPDDSVLVTITATDSDGDSSSTSFQLNVDNVAPAVAANSALVTADEGDTATNTGTYSDAGNDSVALVASVGIVVNNGDGTWSWSYGTADGPDDSVLVTIVATDSDGDGSTTSFQLNVNNVAPSVAANNAVVTVNDGDTATNTGTYADPGVDTVTLMASSGVVIDNGDGTWSWSLVGAVVADSGLVTITATDSDGDATTTTFQLNVNAVSGVPTMPGVHLLGSTLYVIGTGQNDVVAITKASNKIKVVATFLSNNPVTFNLASVTAIEVLVHAGNDVVVVANSVTLPTTIDGGSGSDVLTAGGGNTVIYGGTGNDILIGGPGNNVLIGGDGSDVITGGSGRDLVIGGLHSDLLSGGSGEDIMIGGWTIYDANTAANRSAIDNIMAVWSSSASFNSRIASLTGSGGLLEANEAVFDDDACDIILGGGGRDLLFADTNLWDGAIDLVAYNFLQDALVAVN